MLTLSSVVLNKYNQKSVDLCGIGSKRAFLVPVTEMLGVYSELPLKCLCK